MIITQANSPHLFTNIFIKMMFFDFFSVRFRRLCEHTMRLTMYEVHKYTFCQATIQFNAIQYYYHHQYYYCCCYYWCNGIFYDSFPSFFWPKTILDFGLEFMAFLRFFGCSLCEELKGCPAPSSSDFFIFASLILMFKYKSLKNCNIIFYGNLLKPAACFVLAAITLTTILAKWQYGGLVNLNTKHAS